MEGHTGQFSKCKDPGLPLPLVSGDQKIGDLGLLKSFNKKGNVYTFCRKLMALAFLPHEQIRGAFYGLKGLVSENPPLEQLCHYMERQWITSRFFEPQRWSVFMVEIRTNNDVEGFCQCPNQIGFRGETQAPRKEKIQRVTV